VSFPSPEDLVKPWSYNLPLELLVWFVVGFLGFGIWWWTRSGKDRRRTPDILGRNVEDFAGITQESNGPIPVFLLLFYLTIAIAIIAYPAITLIFGYQY
jgi:hypothetical protein